MNFFKKLNIKSLLIFASMLSFFSGSINASEIGETPNLLAMKSSFETHTVPASTISRSESTVGEDQGLDDHKAQIFEVQGEVRVLKKGSEDWQKASKEMLLEEGDKIVTGENSHVDIAYDRFFLNIVRIEAKTKGEFRSIEPTQLFLEDGTIFSALDGLAGKTYQVSTPTAVAGVRGTTFDISYESKTGNLETHVFPDQSNHLGEIALISADGEELKIVEGQGYSDGVLGAIPEEKMEDAKNFMETVDTKFSDSREEGLQVLVEANEKKDSSKLPEGRLSDREDEKKIGNGPNDGGDSGGDGLKRENSGDTNTPSAFKMDSDVDALVDDAMTPPSDMNSSGASMGNSTLEKRFDDSGKENKDQTRSEFSPQTDKEFKNQPDFDKAVEFLGVGGVNSGNQKDKELNVSGFFETGRTVSFEGKPEFQFVGDSTGNRGESTTIEREKFVKDQFSDFHNGVQLPNFEPPAQFLQTGGSNGYLKFDPNLKIDVKDSTTNNNGGGSTGGSSGGSGGGGNDSSGGGKV